MNLESSPSRPLSPPRVLVVGSLGMLAKDLLLCLSENEITALGFDLPDVDITSLPALHSCVKAVSPHILVNCAAYTAVDRAESEPETAFEVNRNGAANLTAVCKRLSLPIIHISTDYVFDGYSDRPYGEDDPVNPLSVYGKSKWAGEETVRGETIEHIILRTSWLFGAHGHNFVKTILRLAGEREELKVVSDQHGCPTWTRHLSEALKHMIVRILKDRENIMWGTYHYCGDRRTTWHGFAEAILAEAAKVGLPLKASRVSPIETKDYPTPAHRPKWSVLSCNKIAEKFDIMPGNWRDGIADVICAARFSR